MRKILCIFLIIALCFSCVACGRKAANPGVPVNILESSPESTLSVDETVPEDTFPSAESEIVEVRVPSDSETIENSIESDVAESVWQKRDIAAMCEIGNMVQLSLTAPEVYDELLGYICTGNVSCYIDTQSEKEWVEFKHVLKEKDTKNEEEYVFDIYAPRAQGYEYYAAGNMTGITLTFEPSVYQANYVFYFGDVVINKYVRGNGATTLDRQSSKVTYLRNVPDYAAAGLVKEMSSGESHLLKAIKRQVGSGYFAVDSYAYRNACYTIFINVDIDGDKYSVSNIYGQWDRFSIK